MLKTTLAGQNVALVLDFLNKESFVRLKTSETPESDSKGAIACTNSDLCRKLDKRLYTDLLYNTQWKGGSGEVKFMGKEDLTLSLVTTPKHQWYYKDGFGQLSLGPGSQFWTWLKESAKSSEDYFVTFDYNCNPKFSVQYDISTPEKVSKICKGSKMTLGAQKPDTPLVPLEGHISHKDSGNKYYTWIAKGITAEVPFTHFKSKGSKQTNFDDDNWLKRIPKVIKLIEPTDKVCIVPDGNFFMISHFSIKKVTAFAYWINSIYGTVCQGMDTRTNDCSQNGDDVSTGPVVTMTIGGQKIQIRPEEYLFKVDQGSRKKLRYGLSFARVLPIWFDVRRFVNRGVPYIKKNKPCPTGSIALGKYFLSQRSWTIGADKSFSRFSFTFGAAKKSSEEGKAQGAL